MFLLLVLAAYGVTAAASAETAARAFGFFMETMWSVSSALVIVFFLLLAAELFFETTWIRRNLGSEAGGRGWLIAAAGGVLAAGPIYAWYALLQDLRGKGMSASVAAVFLYSRAVKLPLLPLMIHYFGTAFTVVLCLYLIAFSIVNGALMARFEDRAAARS